MSITKTELSKIRFVALPEVAVRKRVCPALEITALRIPSETLAASPSALDSHGKNVISIQMDAGDGRTFTIAKQVGKDLFSAAHGVLQVKNMSLDGETLRADGKAIWSHHQALPQGSLEPLAETIRKSWKDSLRIIAEQQDAQGNWIGLRAPQIGALHALASHWTLEERAALIVMPTGTGKTEVMLAHMVMTAPERLLVLVPSDALREQTLNKFAVLGILQDKSIVAPTAQKPIVGLLKKAPKSKADFPAFRQCNVVISTVAMLEQMESSLLKQFTALFDSVYFDEAHHLRALSWERIHKALIGQKIVAFTATPYREDGLRIPLRIIYNYPLRLAQINKYFRAIDFIEVNEIDQGEADEQIAEKAVARLRADDAKGYEHIILARADSRQRAKHLFDTIYRPNYGDLKPALIYSGIPGRKDILSRIRSGHHRIVVCVDMFGEGFDLPALKVAAMHDIHRSLAITLQFTGRFTRNALKVGDAALIANVAEPRVSDAVEELYAEDPDWNAIIPQLSARAVQSQIDFAAFLDRMPGGEGDEKGLFDLNIIRPKTSTVIYHCANFEWKHFKKGLKRDTKVHRCWPSRDRDLLVFVTRTRLPIEWATIKETTDEIWDLFILYYDKSRKLLFVHSSQKGSLHSDLAKAVGGDSARIIEGEQVFKVMHGISRLVLYNVGLYGRGKLRFRMLTGLDIGEAIGATAQAGSTKSNLFGAGYLEGKRVSIGASAKGRVWSMASSAIPEWMQWCGQQADKLLDASLRTDGILKHTLIPTVLATLPNTDVVTILLPDEWLDATASYGKVTAAGKQYDICATGITSVLSAVNGKIAFAMSLADEKTLAFELTWGPAEGQFGVLQTEGPDTTVRVENRNEEIATFFRENPPVLLLVDGSEVRGGKHLKPSESHPFTFDVATIIAADWAGVPLNLESKWKNGMVRPASIQGKMIADCIVQNNSIVFDDDDAGEAADIVEIGEQNGTVTFKLFHCKFSSGTLPGERKKDLYEVCGQAVRSSRLVHNPDALFRQLERREKTNRGGRPTRFEKGDRKTLVSLRRRLRKLRTRFEIYIVQPGLSKAAIQADLASVLGAADTYLRETTGAPLQVIASP